MDDKEDFDTKFNPSTYLLHANILELLGLCHNAQEECWTEMTVLNIVVNSGYLSLYEMQEIAGDKISAALMGKEVNIADDLII
ncbi:MAG: hypothetical protein NWS20_01590 [Rickettsiaceae bacterium]|nr:hypothetical protein [Rickettsiaceae bacterium]MDP4832512.1 hypothetical protein [Rickettsiaceae bacterium]MDP5020722.1 hypothetical protein [Rickettsiaceae bacterium]MDP5083738.1 hypothetical protein [Rickettsiaceae bacterium]